MSDYKPGSYAPTIHDKAPELLRKIAGLLNGGGGPLAVSGATPSNILVASNGDSLEAKRDAAVSGQAVVVGPGEYAITGNIGKDGVHWSLSPGTVLSLTADFVAGIFDDRADGANAAFAFTLDGAGDLSMTSTGDGVTAFTHLFTVTNADSDVSVRARRLGMDSTAGNDSSGLLFTQGGKLNVEAEEIVQDGNGYCLYWENGDMRVRANRIVGDGNGAITSNCTSAPTGKLWVEAMEITCAGAAVIYTEGNQTAARVWVNALEISQTSGAQNALQLGGSEKFYLTAQKVSNAGAASTIKISAGEAWITIQKITSSDTFLELTGGVSEIEVLQLEVGTSSAVPCIICSGGTHRIRGARFVGGASSKGISISGGTLILEDCHIDVSGTGGDSEPAITKSGGTLIIGSDCVLKPGALGQSIAAATAQNVINRGYKTTYAKSANVTLKGVTSETVSTDFA